MVKGRRPTHCGAHIISERKKISPELFALRLYSGLASHGFDKGPLQAYGYLWGQWPSSDSVRRLRHQTWIREKVTQSVLNWWCKWVQPKMSTNKSKFHKLKLMNTNDAFLQDKRGVSPTQKGVDKSRHVLTHPAMSSGEHGEHETELT